MTNDLENVSGVERAGDRGRVLCGAQKRQGEPGELCTQPAGWGTPHVGVGRCKLHGGNTRNQVAAAMAELEERAALALRGRLAAMAVPVEATDAAGTIQAAQDAAVGRLVGAQLLAMQAADELDAAEEALTAEGLERADYNSDDDEDDEDTGGGKRRRKKKLTPAQLRVLSARAQTAAADELHRAAVLDAATVGRISAQAGVQERQTRVVEAQAVMLAQAIRAITDRLNLTAEQRSALPAVAREVLSTLPVNATATRELT